MLSALCWVSGKSCKSIPGHYEPTEEEIKEAKELMEESGGQQILDERMEDMSEEHEEEEEKTNESSKKAEIDLSQVEKEFNMENYDEDELNPDSIFGGNVSKLTYYENPEEDPHLNMEVFFSNLKTHCLYFLFEG